MTKNYLLFLKLSITLCAALVLSAPVAFAAEPVLSYEQQYEQYQQQLKLYNQQMEVYNRQLRAQQKAASDNDSQYRLPGQYSPTRNAVPPTTTVPVSQQYQQKYNYNDQTDSAVKPQAAPSSGAYPNYYY